MSGLRTIAGFLTCLLLSLAASPAALATQPLPPETTNDQSPVRLEARITQQPERAGDPVVFDVIATDTGTDALSGYLPTPCDSPFNVVVTVEATGAEVARLSPPQGPCIQVIAAFSLEPGQSYSERFRWTMPAGEYTVRAAFRLAGDHPVNAALSFPLSLRPNHWINDYLPEAVRLGLITDVQASGFDPLVQISWAAFRQLLAKAGGLEEYLHWESRDFDVKVTRAEAALMAVQALGLDGARATADPARLPFSDRTEVAEWELPYVQLAADLGIIKGYDDSTFRPRVPISQAEALAIALRMQGANAFQVDSDIALEVNGLAVRAPGIAVLKRLPASPVGLAPLSELAHAADLKVTVTDGWYILSRGESSLRIQPHRSYGECGTVTTRFCHGENGVLVSIPMPPPVEIAGELFISSEVLRVLGFQAHYDPASRKFTVGR